MGYELLIKKIQLSLTVLHIEAIQHNVYKIITENNRHKKQPKCQEYNKDYMHTSRVRRF